MSATKLIETVCEAAKVGDYTFPYSKPPGTKAVKVVKIVGDILHLSDGSQMHSSYFRPVSKGTVREVAPPGWEPTVKAMKKHGEIDNPYALAWYLKGKGYKSRK